MQINIRGRLYRFIPFIIGVLILLFCFLLIVNACYKYHLETEERRLLLNTVKCKDCRLLVEKKEAQPVEEIKFEKKEKPVRIIKSEWDKLIYFREIIRKENFNTYRIEELEKHIFKYNRTFEEFKEIEEIKKKIISMSKFNIYDLNIIYEYIDEGISLEETLKRLEIYKEVIKKRNVNNQELKIIKKDVMNGYITKENIEEITKIKEI
jgi:hypothetical protein